MQIDFSADVPIFMQIAEQIESAILSGALEEGAQAPSTTEISVRYKINPATALKGVTKLADDGVLYKKRGLGMFVSDGAWWWRRGAASFSKSISFPWWKRPESWGCRMKNWMR